MRVNNLLMFMGQDLDWIFLAGEVVSDFPSAHKINPNMFRFNLNSIDTESFNSISIGGWQYIIFYDESTKSSKDVQYLKNNLKTIIVSNQLSDILLIVSDGEM